MFHQCLLGAPFCICNTPNINEIRTHIRKHAEKFFQHLFVNGWLQATNIVVKFLYTQKNVMIISCRLKILSFKFQMVFVRPLGGLRYSIMCFLEHVFGQKTFNEGNVNHWPKLMIDMSVEAHFISIFPFEKLPNTFT